MFKLGLKLIKFLLIKNLNLDERNELTKILLNKLDAFPLHCVIGRDQATGEILISGNRLDFEKATQLRESAKIAKDNKALKLINEQVLYEAISMGVHEVKSPLELLFARAAMWYGEQQRKHLEDLSGQQDEII